MRRKCSGSHLVGLYSPLRFTTSACADSAWTSRPPPSRGLPYTFCSNVARTAVSLIGRSVTRKASRLRSGAKNRILSSVRASAIPLPASASQSMPMSPRNSWRQCCGRALSVLCREMACGIAQGEQGRYPQRSREQARDPQHRPQPASHATHLQGGGIHCVVHDAELVEFAVPHVHFDRVLAVSDRTGLQWATKPL